MRVLVLTHRLPYPPNRGDRIRAYHLIRVLAGSMDVDVVSLVHSHDEERGANRLRDLGVRVSTAMVPQVRNLVSSLLALPGRTPLTHVLLHSPAVDGTIERMVASVKPDVVLAYCSGMAQYALRPPLSDIPFVLDMVDVDSAKWAALSRTARVPMSMIYRREASRLAEFEQAATARAAVTTVVNDRENAAVRAINPRARVETVSNGIDIASFRPTGEPSTQANVVFCGVFDYEPNEDGAVWLATEVWPRVLQRRPDATLTLIGMNPTRRVRSLASTPSIHVTGAVPDVRPYLWNAAVAAAPLFIARGLQNKVLEAIGANLPCVITPEVADGLPRSVHPACATASTAEEFAAALLSLLNSSPAERRARAARADLADLAWETQLSPMAALLERAAHGSVSERAHR